MDNNEHKTAEAIVAQNLAGTTAHPPLLSPTEVKNAALGDAVPPSVQRSASSLSTEHLLPEVMHDRKTGMRAWLHEMGVTAKSNYFGVRQRMQASHVATALRQAPPEEQRELLRTIESNLDYKDAHTVAALYTIVCSNHELPQFKVRLLVVVWYRK